MHVGSGMDGVLGTHGFGLLTTPKNNAFPQHARQLPSPPRRGRAAHGFPAARPVRPQEVRRGLLYQAETLHQVDALKHSQFPHGVSPTPVFEPLPEPGVSATALFAPPTRARKSSSGRRCRRTVNT